MKITDDKAFIVVLFEYNILIAKAPPVWNRRAFRQIRRLYCQYFYSSVIAPQVMCTAVYLLLEVMHA
jgi:hypothetical protein